MTNNTNNFSIKVPPSVKKILSILREAGHEAYIVGGCVRDSVLEREPGDWDITTSALPLEVKSLFYNTVDTGLQHGTVMVLMGGEGYEITTYRKDGAYTDSRRPDSVEFTPSLEEDLKRRDFTINAFAYNEESGIVDLFDGMADLKNKVIRCVGDADQRFSEDALRIMRAVRFAAQLSFEIEPLTLAAIRNHAENLSKISMERIRVEFEKTLMSDNPNQINRYKDLGLDAYIIPGEELCAHCFTESSLPFYEQFPLSKEADSEEKQKIRYLRTAAFLKDLSPDDAAKVIRTFTYDNKTKELVTKILKYKDMPIPPDRKYVKRALNLMGEEVLDLVWAYKKAARKAEGGIQVGELRCFEMRDDEMLDDAIELTEDIIKSGEAYKISMLMVKGNDIMEAGVKPGAEVGQTLEYLLQLVIDHPELNSKEYLVEETKKYRTKQ